MHRRAFIQSTAIRGTLVFGLPSLVASAAGCRGHQYGHVLTDDQDDLVGSHTAGSEIYKPLIDEAVDKLLGQAVPVHHPAAFSGPEVLPAPKRVCFVGVENLSSEELGDFRDQIYQLIDARLVESQVFQPISRRYLDAALRETALRPADLFLPRHQRDLSMALERQGQPLDYILFATITSGTTENNRSYQRDYLLRLEMVNLVDGTPLSSTARLRKGYHPSRAGKWRLYNPFGS